MRWLVAILALLLLAGCMGEEDEGDDNGAPTTTAAGGAPTTSDDPGDGGDMMHVAVGDDSFEVEGDPDSNNGNTTAAVGHEFMFVNEGQRDHTVTIHKVGDALNVTVLDEVIAPGEEVGYTFAQATTYHVWCRYHGTMTGGMHLTVVVA